MPFSKILLISEKEKKTVLKNVFEGQISREMMNFLFILIDKGRAGMFDRHNQRIQEAADKQTEWQTVRIISAAPLTEEQLAEI